MTTAPNPDAHIEALFAQRQDKLDAVFRANESTFPSAFKEESELRKAIWTSEARTLRGLQMRAMAFASDGCGVGQGAERPDQLAAGWRAAMDEDLCAAQPVQAYAAFSLARDLIRLAEADPNGPCYPTVLPRSEWHPDHFDDEDAA